MTDSYRNNRYSGGDSYYPRRSRSRSPRRDDIYRFGGANLRGGDGNPRRDYDNGDSYGRGDFSFRKETQTQWPTEPYADRNRRPRNSHNNRGGRGGRGGRWQARGSKAANERQILNTGMDRDVTPERLAGMTNGAVLFNPDDISEDDSNESDADMDEDSSGGDKVSNGLAKVDSEEGPLTKRPRKELDKTDGNDKPKWSNPDPYYLAPILEDANAKKKDVVEIIRKAKIAAEKEKEQSTNAVAKNDDFISFAMDEDEEEDKSDHISISSDDAPVETFTTGTANESRAENSSTTSNPVPFSHLTNFHPLLASSSATTSSRSQPTTDTRRETDTWPPRSNQDAINMPQRRDGNSKHNGNKRKRNENGDLTSEWIEDNRARAIPWVKEDHSNLKSTSVWLHKEICDFYEFVRPTAHEHAIRKNLVDRIARALKKNYRDYTLHSFGSYAYGIYLPTADMDLCLVSDRYQRTGQADINLNYSQLRKALVCLQQAGIPADHDQQVIAKAKVPIIKFVDRLTGLKVDISFENTTGITALSSFNSWKAEFPQFTALVTLIKQFLLMRDLNEVFSGGLGGFSVACLVVSMLQHSPDVQSANPPTLGALLLRFFKLYGNDFNMTSLAISVNPPMYIPKVSQIIRAYTKFHKGRNTNTIQDVYDKSYGKAKWLIWDPHNRDNDVSGGSTKAELIADKFYEAYQVLRDVIDHLGRAGPILRKGQSILRPIFGGNYQSFIDQREQLHDVYDRMRVDGYFS
jgi:non-canonical poly(A) RNA polymerase PAPD5/7